jgi:hypothetical protein
MSFTLLNINENLKNKNLLYQQAQHNGFQTFKSNLRNLLHHPQVFKRHILSQCKTPCTTIKHNIGNNFKV